MLERINKLYFICIVFLFSQSFSVLAQEPTPEEAAEEHLSPNTGAHGSEVHSPLEVLGNEEFQKAVINFGLLVFLLVFFGRRKIRAYLLERKQTLEEDINEAKRLKIAAEEKRKEYTDRLANLDKELGTIKAEMIKSGEAERDRIIAEAEEKAARLRDETDFIIEQRMKSLREELLKEAADAAIQGARQILAEKMTRADQERIAEKYLQSIQNSSKRGLV